MSQCFQMTIDPFSMEVTGVIQQEAWNTLKNLLSVMTQKGEPDTHPVFNIYKQSKTILLCRKVQRNHTTH